MKSRLVFKLEIYNKDISVGIDFKIYIHITCMSQMNTPF